MAERAPQLVLRALLLTLGATAGWDIVLFLGSSLEWSWALGTALSVVFHVSLLLALATGVLLAVRWPDELAGRLIASFVIFFAAAWGVRVLGVVAPGGSALPRLTGLIGLGRVPGEVLGFTSFWLAMAAFVRFSAVFPEPLSFADLEAGRGGGDAAFPGRLGRARSVLRLQRGLNAVFTLSFRPLALWSAAVLVGAVASPALHTGGDPGGWAFAEVVLWIPFFTFLAINIETSFKRHSFADRRMLWVGVGLLAAAFSLSCGAFLLMFSESVRLAFLQLTVLAEVRTAVALPLVLAPAIPFVTAAILIATFHAGRLDPGLAIQRTTVVGLLSVLGIFVFGAVENLLSDFVSARLGLPANTGSWLAGGAAAIAISALRGSASRWSRAVLASSAPLPPQSPEQVGGRRDEGQEEGV